MAKQKFKVSREVLLQINDLVPALPELQVCNTQNQGLYDILRIKSKGCDLPKGTMVHGKPVEPNRYYVRDKKIPRLVDHKERLIKLYKELGQDGINQHIDWCQQVIAKEPELKAAERDEFNEKQDILKTPHMNKNQFESKIDIISDQYETIKDALHLLNSCKMTIEDRKKVVAAYDHLKNLRDAACVSLRELNNELIKPECNDLHKRIRQADVNLSRCLFQMNKPIRGSGEADEHVIYNEALNAFKNLGAALNIEPDPTKFIL